MQLVFKGQQLAVRLKTAELLTEFLSNRGSLLSKEDLLCRIWGESHVSNAVLFQTIADLRKVLGTTSKSPRFLRNIKGMGYIWIYENVIEETPDDLLAIEEEASQPVLDPEAQDGELFAFPESLDEQSYYEQYEDERPLSKCQPNKQAGWIVLTVAILMALLLCSIRLVVTYGNRQLATKSEIEILLLPIKNVTGTAQFDWVEQGLTDMMSLRLEGTGHFLVDLADVQADPFLDPIDQAQTLLKRGNHTVLTCSLEVSEQGFVLEYTLLQKNSPARERSQRGSDPMICVEKMARELTFHLSGINHVRNFSEVAARDYGHALEALGNHQPLRANYLLERVLQWNPNMAWAKIHMATTLSKLGQIKRAHFIAEQAMREAIRIRDQPQQRACLTILASVAMLGGNFERARAYQETVLALENPPRLQLLEEIHMGQILTQLCRFNLATELLQDCLARAASLEMGYLRALCHERLGELCLKITDWHGAIEQFHKAAHLYALLHLPQKIVPSLLGLSTANARLGELVHSDFLLEDALDMAKGQPLDNLIPKLIQLGESLFDLGDFQRALTCYEQVAALTLDFYSPANTIRANFRLAEVHLRLAQPELGLPFLKTCLGWFNTDLACYLSSSFTIQEVQRLDEAYQGVGT